MIKKKQQKNEAVLIFVGKFSYPESPTDRRLNGDGFIANETRIHTAGTTSVSTCRPAYCFRRTCGKSVLGTKVLGNAVPERTTNFGWPAVQKVRDLCVYFFLLVFPFAPNLLFSLK